MATLNIGIKIHSGVKGQANFNTLGADQVSGALVTTTANQYAVLDLSVNFSTIGISDAFAFLIDGDLSRPLWGVSHNGGTVGKMASDGDSLANLYTYNVGGSVLTNAYLITPKKQFYLPPSSTVVFRARFQSGGNLRANVFGTLFTNTQ